MKALALLVLLAVAGCCSTHKHRDYMVDTNRIIFIECKDAGEIEQFLTGRLRAGERVLGYNDTVGPVTKLVVPWGDEEDKDGNPLPDFYVLGHELWHCPELGGHFHK